MKISRQQLMQIIQEEIEAVLNERKWGKAQGRDYSKEKKTAGDKKNIKRKRDRYKAEKEGRVKKGDGKDVHHPKG